MHEGLRAAGLPENAVQVVATTDRAAVGYLIADDKHVDVIVPRGGKGLIERITREAKVPVIKHLDGVCHVFIDATADLDMAIRVADNAKTQRYSPCNTMETLLVHAGIAPRMLPPLAAIYLDKGVELRGDEHVARARPGDEGRDRGRLVRRVPGADPRGAHRRRRSTTAIAHIAKYGSQHTDAIVTEHHGNAMRFLREVDSSSVMINASTRFADGFEYGLGAEIGISTNKLHARGPVGLEGLTQPQVGRARLRPDSHLDSARSFHSVAAASPRRMPTAKRWPPRVCSR